MFLLFFVFLVAPSQSPSLPHSNASFQEASPPGIFSFSPANMINAVKQKSAFAPVMRPGYSPPIGSIMTTGWPQTVINVSMNSIAIKNKYLQLLLYLSYNRKNNKTFWRHEHIGCDTISLFLVVHDNFLYFITFDLIPACLLNITLYFLHDLWDTTFLK